MSVNAVQASTTLVRCPRCERQMTVVYRPSQPPIAVKSTIVCPFCDHESIVELEGKVASVVAQDLRKPR
jgi:transposase-like protein